VTAPSRRSARRALGFALESVSCAATAGLAVFLALLIKSGPAAAAPLVWLAVWWMPLLLLSAGAVGALVLRGFVRMRNDAASRKKGRIAGGPHHPSEFKAREQWTTPLCDNGVLWWPASAIVNTWSWLTRRP
jgi:hypothetical protein